MSQGKRKLVLYCNDKEVYVFTGNKSMIKDIIDDLGWYKIFHLLTPEELADISNLYLDHIPSMDLKNSSINSYEFRLKKYKNDRMKFDIILPWKIEKQINGELVFSNWLSGGEIKMFKEVSK